MSWIKNMYIFYMLESADPVMDKSVIHSSGLFDLPAKPHGTSDMCTDFLSTVRYRFTPFFRRVIMPKLTINDLPMTQSEMMNRDHGEFIIILNKLIDLVNQTDGNNVSEIDAILNDLKTHTEEHFAREEALMVRADFPPYPMHKGEHDRVLTILRDSMTHWKLNRDRKVMGELLNEQLPQWLINHIATMDSVTSQFLANSGVLLEE